MDNEKIERNLAYILGALRDGTFTRNEKFHIYRIRVYQKNKNWILKLKKKFQRMFEKIPSILQDKRTRVWCLRLNSKRIYKKMVEKAEFPGKQEKWSVPSWILNSSHKIQKTYLKGFFDSEGGVPHVEERNLEPKDIRIHFSQNNKKCLEEIREMLQEFGIHTGKVCGPYYRKMNGKAEHELIIHGIHEVTKFYRRIGTLHEEKRERLEIIEKM